MKIKPILLNKVNEGMILARDVIDNYGRILLTAEIPLKQSILDLLKKHNITSVFVKNIHPQNDEIAVTPDVITMETRLKLISNVKDAFCQPNGLVEHLPQLETYVENVVHTLIKRKNILLHLTDINDANDYLFMHSVNVGLFSIVIGIAMNLSFDELCLLGMGGLLHDLGKTKIAPEILNKEGNLTLSEFDDIKRHASLGYKMLKVDAHLDYRIIFMALQHHERCNGSGYPWGILKNKIHPLSRIVAVADVYDALTTDRVYRSKLSSFSAMNIINEGDRIHFDHDVITAFNKVVIPYHIGNPVTLTDGKTGNVVGLNSLNLVRPVISTDQGIVNLLYEPHLQIIGAK